jgi:hypothetical protein
VTQEKQPNNKQLILLMAAVITPIMASASLLSNWLSKPLAWAVPVFVWCLAIFWLPPKPKVRPWHWLIIVSLLSVAVFLLVKLDLNPF